MLTERDPVAAVAAGLLLRAKKGCAFHICMASNLPSDAFGHG